MGRYKLGPQGAYYDENDSGPDQASADQISALQGDRQNRTDATPGQNSEGAGGLSGHNQDFSPQDLQTNEAPEVDPGVQERGYTAGQNGRVTPISGGGAAPSPYMFPSYQPGGTPFQNPGDFGATSNKPPTGATPAGFDQTKWSDPAKSDPKYNVGRAEQANPNMTAEQAAQIAGPGYSVYGKDKLIDQNGDIYDFKNASGAPQWTWIGNKNTWAADAASGAGSVTAPAPTRPSSGSGGGGNPGGGGGGVNAQDPAVYDAVMRLLGRGESPTNASDPNIAGPTAAFRAQTDQSTRQARQALAERAAATGLNSEGQGSGFLDTGIQSQMEQAGRDVGSYAGQLTVQEIQAKRQDVVNALGFAQGEEKIALEAQLANLNAQLQREQMGQQNTQFYDTMGYNINRDQNELDYLMAQYLR